MKEKHTREYWENKIEEIMNHFDFAKTYKVMEALDWEWASAVNGIPNVDELRKSARGLMERAVNDYITGTREDNWCACGGFLVEVNRFCGELSLKFVAVEWEAEDLS